MTDKTWGEIVRTLSESSAGKADVRERLDVLVVMIFDLLMEVEALRAAQLAASNGANGIAPAYGCAYRDTAYLTHNCAGPSSGMEKLLARFYPQETANESGAAGERRTWRECLMLRRLGFSEEQLRAYQEAAKQAEDFT